MKTKRQYLLKPGRHQFVPGAQALYHNGNLTDDEARWYLKHYPHIKQLFKKLPKAIAIKVLPAGEDLGGA